MFYVEDNTGLQRQVLVGLPFPAVSSARELERSQAG